MTGEVGVVPLSHPSKQSAFRYVTSSVACGDTFPSRGRTWGRTSFRFRVHRNGLRVKIPPLEGRVASGVPRKPDDGRGDLRSASAFVETTCDPVRHLFRRLRRHLPLKGKDLGVELVPFCVRRNGLRVKSLPSRGGWHPASPASRMMGEVGVVPLSQPSKQSAFRYDTSSVACGDTFPSRGRT